MTISDEPGLNPEAAGVLLQGTCHCGAVRLTLPAMPERATSCNCSLCHRLGGVWGYFGWGEVRIDAAPGALTDYAWGDRTLRTMRCRHCGCATHWEPMTPKDGDRHGVNLRMFPRELLERVHVRRFDGADTWTFLDE